MTPPYGRVIWSIFFQLYSLRRFEVSLHNPSCKLRKTMPTGALSYLNALTDTRRCLPCTIIIRGKRKYVNPHAKSTPRKTFAPAAAAAILPARMCRNSDQRE